MRTIGFRAGPSQIVFAVYDTEENRVIAREYIKIPNALTVPQGLRYLRSNTLDILREYEIERAVIRIPESSAQKVDLRRTQFEAILQEVFASSSVQGYGLGQISTMTKLLGVPRTYFKEYIANTRDYEMVENWSTLKTEEKEAVLAAIGAQNVETL